MLTMAFVSEVVAFLALLTGLPKGQAHVSLLGVMLPATVVTLWEALRCWHGGT